MDKPIEKKTWSAKTIALLLLLGLTGAIVLLTATRCSSGSRVTIDSRTISVSDVEEGEFHEYVRVVGRITPIKTVFVSVIQGGQVEEIFVESGQPIKAGDPILRLSNDSFLQGAIENEGRYIVAIQQLRESKNRLMRERLSKDDELLDAIYELLKLQRQRERVQGALERNIDLISRAEVQDIDDKIEYRIKKNDILARQLQQDAQLRAQQLTQIKESLKRSQKNVQMIQSSFNNLVVMASITGRLSTLSAEIGKTISESESIGQIDDLSSFKVRAEIDQFYISKVVLGQNAEMTVDGQNYTLNVSKISPEVVDNVFIVDLNFVSDAPSGVRPGQSIPVNLELSSRGRALLVKKGGYYRDTGGRWIYKLSEDGLAAHRQDIRLGRQNPNYYEVVEGLELGDRVITSSYSRYGDTDELKFDSPL
jgi:HlyD family secretion protein